MFLCQLFNIPNNSIYLIFLFPSLSFSLLHLFASSWPNTVPHTGWAREGHNVGGGG
ncbi:hypothetical protein HMPREF0972_02004 [Actinomyces sp. oral taxon 848 str. F0332]|nr:hypothetical protein HMPREF0972_02004 [Actinomyces sp. oral taxon 848 str. F0332]